MLRLVAAVSTIALIATNPAFAQKRFVGALTYTAAENCSFSRAGQRFGSAYMPSGLSGIGNQTFLSETFDVGAHGYTVTGRLTSNLRNVRAFSASYGAFEYAGVRIRISTSSPADGQIKDSTKFIQIEGQIERPQGDPGVGGPKCVVDFRATYTRHAAD